ncbi:hypothetical protein [Dyella telluris]|uniref:Uncharacterized protein n=1 Tax=Dyella telluris TaxID=2763498 RepID=A0A7G8Q5M0_9GAMM|nr:hypothetical protein [Dyella telluris]QNK02078.1 hypothetical protein H8F01_02630 [Dyella telluris]
MTSNETYPALPEGPVFCEDCSRPGAKVEMEPHRTLPREARQWAEEQGVELRSYRCPDCEAIQVFRVS